MSMDLSIVIAILGVAAVIALIGIWRWPNQRDSAGGADSGTTYHHGDGSGGDGD